MCVLKVSNVESFLRVRFDPGLDGVRVNWIACLVHFAALVGKDIGFLVAIDSAVARDPLQEHSVGSGELVDCFPCVIDGIVAGVRSQIVEFLQR